MALTIAIPDAASWLLHPGMSMIQSAGHTRVCRIQELSEKKIKRSCYAQGDHVGDYQMLFDHDMDEHSRHDIDPTCRYNAIESVKKMRMTLNLKRLRFMRQIIIMRLKLMEKSQQRVIHYYHY